MAILGDGYVGKTAILRRLKGESFDHDYKITVGADFAVKEMKYKHDRVTLRIWDVGGQERFAPLRSRYYKNAAGVLIVFDLMKRSTFENIPVWLNEVLENNQWRLVPILLVGNKNDLLANSSPEITKEEIIEYVHTLRAWGREMNPDFKIDYLETSAKSGKNVIRAFDKLISMILGKKLIQS